MLIRLAGFGRPHRQAPPILQRATAVLNALSPIQPLVAGIAHRTGAVVDIQQNGVVAVRMLGQNASHVLVANLDPRIGERFVREVCEVLAVPFNNGRHQFAYRDGCIRCDEIETRA